MPASSEPTIVHWEGEWPLLKRQVRNCRLVSADTVLAARRLITQRSVEVATENIQYADNAVHEGSVAASRYILANPWLGRATGVTAAATFVAKESFRYWGAVAAVRNGAVVGVAATLFAFPDASSDAFYRVLGTVTGAANNITSSVTG